MEEKKELTLNDKIDFLFRKQVEEPVKSRRFNVPRKAKVSGRALKKGYTTIMRIDENGNVDFEKQQIEGNSYRLSTGEYHSLREGEPERDILSYRGKPFVIQATKRLNPYNPLSGRNETSGQSYVMARMLGDTIKTKAKSGNILIWIAVAGAVLFGLNYFLGSGAG